jgi:N-acetylglucosamine-6-phosphate deacetylase
MGADKRTLYITDYCLTPGERINNSGILCEDNKILAVGGASAFVKEPGLHVVELPGAYAMPGFVDTHIHGAGGFDASLAYEENADISLMSALLASRGVTSFVPTVASGPKDKMLAAISCLASMLERDMPGAEPVGIHVEGPFLCPEKRGSQRLEDLRTVDIGLAREIAAAGRGKIIFWTFAPELSGAEKLIELMLENSIKPSMGHSQADEEHVLRAVEAGALRCTHLYNGMPPLHQRDICLTSVALTDDRITIEMISDGYHIHPRMVDLACRSKPKDKLLGISDAVQAAGLGDGDYRMGLVDIKVSNGHAVTKDGVIAGTTLTLDKVWYNFLMYSHMKPEDSAACFTLNPARDAGLQNRGEIAPGKRADIAVFDAFTNKTRLTVVAGKIVHSNGSQEDRQSANEQ